MASRRRERKTKRIDLRTRTAYHEAGHAVLSAAINDAPHIVSIRPHGDTLGRTGQKMFARPQVLVQVHLAGVAAEHILIGSRPQDSSMRLGFAMIAAVESSAILIGDTIEGSDEHKAVS